MPEGQRSATSRVLCLLVLGLATCSRPNPLNDASIQKLYADQAAAEISSGSAVREHLNAHLDANYSQHVVTAKTIGDDPPKRSERTYTRAQLIDSAAKGADAIRNPHYSVKITSVS